MVLDFRLHIQPEFTYIIHFAFIDFKYTAELNHF
jgi:hypothetical protein